MNKRYQWKRALLLIFVAVLVLQASGAELYASQARPKSSSSYKSSSSSRSSSKAKSSGSSKSTSKASKSSDKVSSGNFTSKKENANKVTPNKTTDKINSGNFTQKKESATKPEVEQKDTYSKTYRAPDLGTPRYNYGTRGFNSWYYRMPVVRYISPTVLVVVLVVVVLFAMYWYWRRRL